MKFRPGPSRHRQRTEGRPDALELSRIQQALDEHSISVEAGQLIHFIRSAVRQREYFKFEFTKSLSLILELLIRTGNVLEIARQDLSWLKIEDFKIPQYMIAEELKDRLETLIQRRHVKYQQFRELSLPEVIVDRTSLDVVEVYEARPN